IKRLKEVFGCVAQAISHLHHNRIRHKDFKPSQVLLSPHGTWLTDFGWSNAVSETMNDTTSGGDAITAKYHAPERAVKNPCGRPEDIFALGCSYLEM
ncbi:kinase-like domain-containing protein, partial [Pyrenochaeta sp. MPI-SDFR-AT-0127]